MALRATNKWRSMLVRLGGNRPFATSTPPKMKLFSQNVHASRSPSPTRSMREILMKGEYTPIAMVLGLCLVALGFATHTAKQQLMHFPGVGITKKKRGSLSEVDDPDVAISSADKFINKSVLRNVAHIQDPSTRTIPDPSRPDPFTRRRKAETLKTVGVDPSRH